MSNEIKVVVFEPEKDPYVKMIPNTLEEAQKIVGGFIEVVPNVVSGLVLFDLNHKTDFVIICNEEGILLNLPDNRHFKGTFFAVGTKPDSEEFHSLSDELIKELLEKL